MSATTDSSDPLSTGESRRVLTRVLRVIFPHAEFSDAPYERTAERILNAAGESTWHRVVVSQGIETLASDPGGSIVDLPDGEAHARVQAMEATPFFAFVRATAVVHLYDDDEVWRSLGYEGPSFEKGGYINRGFDDLDWLPDPRVEYLEGEELIEIGPLASPVGGERTAS